MTRILMADPRYFDVIYQINPWMHPGEAVNNARARQQWAGLCSAYRDLGADVSVLPAAADLPDFAFATDASLTIDHKTALARFMYDERQHEVRAHQQFFTGNDHYQPRHCFEGGDAQFLDGILLLGHGFRTQLAAHSELADFFGLKTISLQLTNPRFYHLDTALTVVNKSTIAYLPLAFSIASRRALRNLGATLIEATQTDADAFGLNSFTIGSTVVMSAGATGLRAAYHQLGLEALVIDTSEFQKSGGGIKCLTNAQY